MGHKVIEQHHALVGGKRVGLAVGAKHREARTAVSQQPPGVAREALGVALGSRIAIGAPGSLDLDRFEATVASTCRVNPVPHAPSFSASGRVAASARAPE